MSPTVFRLRNYRFFFFSREEKRQHIHVSSPNGEAKFWIEPIVSLSEHVGMNERELRQIETIVQERRNEIAKAWKKHFSR